MASAAMIRRSFLNGMFPRLLSTHCLEYTSHGDPLKVLSFKEKQIGSVGVRQVLLKSLAAPVNPADLNMIEGRYPIKPKLPAIGGGEGVSQVEEVGSEVSNLTPGDWVIPSKPGLGTWCNYRVLDKDDVIKIRKDIPLLCAATLSVNPCTAYRMLKDFVSLERGQVVIQNGANSAVGQGVIQLGREMGLITINLLRARQNIDQTRAYLKSLGANYVLTYDEMQLRHIPYTIWRDHGRAKLALNCVGGENTLPLSYALENGGKLVTYGGMANMPIQVSTGSLIFRSIELHGFWMSRWNADKANHGERLKMLSELMDMMKDGRYVAPLFETAHISDFSQALLKSSGGFAKKQIFTF